MKLGVPKETYPGENRVSISPDVVAALAKLGVECVIETGAGIAAGFPDDHYTASGAAIATDRSSIFADCQIIAQVRTLGANEQQGAADTDLLRDGQVLLGHAEPWLSHEQNQAVASRGATLFAMELIPRITRAQAMDVLSSQANLAGYKAVLMAATQIGRIMPMMMTAAGTIKPARVFVIGAGVAGLQAIATAKRLGAIVSATDVRPVTKEQVESLGGKFIFLEELMVEGEGGYAKELTAEQQEKQKKLVADVVAESDIVITTAAIPGRKSPVLIVEETVQRMKPGSVIVDLASERGGNCEATEPGQVVQKHGVTLIGTTNIPSTVPHDASVTYARNLLNLLKLLVKDGKLTIDMEDEVVAGTLLTQGGEIVHPRVREMIGLPPIEKPAAQAEASEATVAEVPAKEGSQS